VAVYDKHLYHAKNLMKYADFRKESSCDCLWKSKKIIMWYERAGDSNQQTRGILVSFTLSVELGYADKSLNIRFIQRQ
jgi:hypothetical protein